MNLHHDKEAFAELIAGAANELAIPTNVIEKDYYVTITLKALAEKIKDMVFKGGTSLTKCYQLLDRFSEDIHKIVETIGITDEISKLIPEVRAIRSEMIVCPSARDGVVVSDVLREIIEKQVYKSDYEDITMGLLFVPEAYDAVIQSLKKIMDSGMWD